MTMDGPRAILHVGTMKTGTSTLQATLAQNDRLLARANWHYLGWPMRTAAQIGLQLAKIAADSNIIVSDEGLWHFCDTTKSDTRAIADIFSDHETTIIVYFRRPDQYVASWFSQGLKSGKGSPDLIEFLSSGFTNSAPIRSDPHGPSPGFDSPAFMQQIDLAILKKLRFLESVFPDAQVVARP
jgi:hypothetical protein